MSGFSVQTGRLLLGPGSRIGAPGPMTMAPSLTKVQPREGHSEKRTDTSENTVVGGSVLGGRSVSWRQRFIRECGGQICGRPGRTFSSPSTSSEEEVPAEKNNLHVDGDPCFPERSSAIFSLKDSKTDRFSDSSVFSAGRGRDAEGRQPILFGMQIELIRLSRHADHQ